MRDQFEIELVTTYTTEEALRRVESGEIDVKDAAVIIDVLTNDIRETRQ